MIPKLKKKVLLVVRLGGCSRLLLACLAAWLAGCASLSSPDLKASPNLKNASVWQVRGKIGCRLQDQSGTLTFKWWQLGTHYKVDFFAPLGSGRMRFAGTHDHFSVTEASGVLRKALDNKDYLDRYLGANMPISALPYWLHGQPDPSVLHVDTPDGFEQHGWRLARLQLAADTADALPIKLGISIGKISCKIRLFDWQKNT